MQTNTRTTSEQRFFSQGAEQSGPVTLAQLRQSATTGRPRREDVVWREGTPSSALTISAPDLYAKYEANEVAADERYKGRIVEA